MNYIAVKKRFLAVLSAVFICSAAFASENVLSFAESLNNLARDIHSFESASDGSIAAIERESSACKSVKTQISKLTTPKQALEALKQLRYYGYRVSSEAEKRAFEEAFNLLKSHIYYLAGTEGLVLTDSLNLVKDIENKAEDNFPRLKLKTADFRSSKKTKNLKTAKKLPPKAASAVLGANVKNKKTCFAVYAPEATDVKLHTFKTASSKTPTVHQMQRLNNGIWSVTLDGELYGLYYTFAADGPKTAGCLFNPERELSDPYAFANVNHDGKSIVVKRGFNWTDQGFKRPQSKDAIIYEMHIKDFTAHKSSGVNEQVRGKYLGVLEGGNTSKVLGHLKELGVNVIELMPIHEYDNNFAGVCNHWGYMTSHFFAPETSYASECGEKAIRELKTLINGLHNNGFAVILDVVYNHTAEGNHEGLPLNFKGLDNAGYYRLMADKNYYWNGTGCGNEMNTESPMTSKMILDSLKYWVNEYHVDGFRFDLGTIIDKNTMQKIIDELPPDTILTAEPWAADWQRNQWSKTNFRNTRLAKWNDDYREKIRAFVSGGANRNDVMTVMSGSCFWWSAKPAESLNYIEAHDGFTLNDLFGGSKKKTRLAAICLLTAQGIPMLHSGQEFNRSKGGNDNSYNQDNDTNYINWQTKEKNRDIFELYRGLISLRKKYQNFRHGTALNTSNVEWLLPPNGNGLGIYLKGKDNFLVLLNGDQSNSISFKMPSNSSFKLICDGERLNLGGLGTFKGDYYTVEPCTGVILQN